MERCDECGFVYEERDATSAPGELRRLAALVADTLAALPAEQVKRRPAEDVWSPHEYGCHVRDVMLVQRERVLAARRTDTPEFEPMGRDERVVDDAYRDQQTSAVVRQLGDAAELLAHSFEQLGDDWDRRVVYGWPTRQERSLRWVAVHTVHELRHHLGDIQAASPPSSEGGADAQP